MINRNLLYVKNSIVLHFTALPVSSLLLHQTYARDKLQFAFDYKSRYTNKSYFTLFIWT